MDFYSAYAQGFARVAAAAIPSAVADPARNARTVIEQVRAADEQAVALVVFPELALSGYAIEDLLLQLPPLDGVIDAIDEIARESADLMPMVVVGAPLRHGSRLYNCAVVIHRGQVIGVVPKSYLPNYREFYEKRHFASGDDQRGGFIALAGRDVPFGPDLLFRAADVTDLVVHVEVCEDMWVPIPPSAEAALAGATVLVNLSGSPIMVGRGEERRLLAQSASARCIAAYVYSAAGQGESTTDLSWDGMTLVYENGRLLQECERFPKQAQLCVADVDLRLLAQERMRMGSFDDNRRTHSNRVAAFRTVQVGLAPPGGDIGLRRDVARFPFVPDDPQRLALDCYEAYNIQVSALAQRLQATGQPKAVIGISGGLDSTHALIVAARAMDSMGRPRSDILAFTMPGFATSAATRASAVELAGRLGVSFEELDIRPAARLMLADMGHPYARGEAVYDVTFENVQAGLRYDYLFRLAGQRGGLVVGTGDLSELALGWCTYGVGDQMSHYNVNAGVPKTLIQHLIRWVADSGQFDDSVGVTLRAVLDTEISPELVPVADGERSQSTEDAIGPYALHDFTLFHVLRFGMSPSRIAFLALHAWADLDAGEWPPGFPPDQHQAYDLATIREWLEVFLQRFFGFAQFKRSALPNGPKVVSGGSLSPRGDWRAPSDGNARAWLAELARDVPLG